MIIPVEIEIETGEPMMQANGTEARVRHASLKLNGIVVFTDLVYDTDADGVRTDEFAARNLLLVLRGKLRDEGVRYES
jgi:hypothetical protein